MRCNTVEDRYWKDFTDGNPLGKYGEIKTINEWQASGDLIYFNIVLTPARQKHDTNNSQQG